MLIHFKMPGTQQAISRQCLRLHEGQNTIFGNTLHKSGVLDLFCMHFFFFLLNLEEYLAHRRHSALNIVWKDQGKLRRQIFSLFSDPRSACVEGNCSSGLNGGVATWNADAWFSLTQFPEIPRELPIGSLAQSFAATLFPPTHPASKVCGKENSFYP